MGQASETDRGKGVGFCKVRRITGYLVGEMSKWNGAKAKEEHDRVKHGTSMQEELNAIDIKNTVTVGV